MGLSKDKQKRLVSDYHTGAHNDTGYPVTDSETQPLWIQWEGLVDLKAHDLAFVFNVQSSQIHVTTECQS